MFRRNKSFKMRLLAGVLAAVLAMTSVDLPAMAQETADAETAITEELSADVSADESTSVSENESEEVAAEEEKEAVADVSDGAEEPSEEDAENWKFSYISVPEDQNAPEYDGGEDNQFEDSLPSSYHTTLASLSDYPQTRSQSPWGSCWAHAAIATAEFSMVSQGYATKSVDYSELALAYFFYNTVEDPLGGTNGDYTEAVGDNYLDRGGNSIFTWRSLATWSGATAESKVPYNHNSSLGTAPDDQYAYDDEAVLTDVRIINPSDRAGVKKAIMESGAVACSYYHSSSYYNSTYKSYYYSGTPTSNHAVSIVGWDDNFSKSKFNTTASGDGAWLIRNSWTTTSGINEYSYFWMSYYDTSLNDNNIYQQIFVPASTYDNNYQYDGATYSCASGYSKVANLFKIGGTGKAAQEELKAVSFACTGATGVSYTIKVYENATKSNLTPGTPVATASGTTTYAGYYTVELDSPVLLTQGTQFSVVIETSGGTVDTEASYGSSSSGWIHIVAHADAGESFIYSNSSWHDWSSYGSSYYGNICIKAFTSDVLLTDGQYRVSFNGNGSTDGKMSSVTKTTSESLTIPACDYTRKGYEFAGWNTKKDGTGTSYAAGDVLSPLGSKEMLTLYAQWSEIFYTISFDGNGADSGSMADRSASAAYILTFPSCTYTKKGYTFTEWNTQADGSGTGYGAGTIIDAPATVNGQTITYYAIWTAIPYTVTFQANGGTFGDGSGVTTTIANYGKAYEFPSDPTRANATFLGWFTAQTGGTIIMEDQIFEEENDVTLYAHWAFSEVTVNFVSNDAGAVISKTSMTAYAGECYGVIKGASGYPESAELPTITSYSDPSLEFDGWYTAAVGGTKVTETTTVPLGLTSITLYGHSKTRILTVSFDLNGGRFDRTVLNPLSVSYGKTVNEVLQDLGVIGIGETMTDPVKAGYPFSSWSAGFTYDTEITSNLTVTALWGEAYDQVETITYSPETDVTLEVGDRISLSTKTNGAKIYYTLDGSMPVAETGILYTDAIVVTQDMADAGTVTVYAIAVRDSYADSDVILIHYAVSNSEDDWGDIITEDQSLYAAASDVPNGLWAAGVTDQTYTGSAITWDDLRFYDHKTLLTKGKDYTITYKNNKNAGTATVTITGKGNYSGTVVKTPAILKQSIDADPVRIPDQQKQIPYTGKAGNFLKPVLQVEGGSYLKEGTDYTVTYTYANATTVTCGKTKNVSRAAGDKVDVKDNFPDHTTINYVVTGKGNYSGNYSDTYTVTSAVNSKFTNVSSCTVTIPAKTYTGSAIELSDSDITVLSGSNTLTLGTDYYITAYSNNTKAGKASVTIEGNPAAYYTGTKTVTFTISKVAINSDAVTAWFGSESTAWGDAESVYYAKGGVKPNVGLTYNGMTLTSGTDYKITWKNNTKAGTASVVFEGKGNYSGKLTKSFTVNKVSLAGMVEEMADYYGANTGDYKLLPVVKQGDTVLKKDTDYTVTWSLDEEGLEPVAGLTDGTPVYVHVTGKGNYIDSETKEFTWYAKPNLAQADIMAEAATYQKGGTKTTLHVSVDGLELTEGTDYTVTYKNNDQITKTGMKKEPTATIKGTGKYTGSQSVTFTINPQTLAADGITLTAADVIYSAKAGKYKSTPVVTDSNGKVLKAKTDYVVSQYFYATDTLLANGTFRRAGSEIGAKDIVPVGTLIGIEVTGTGCYTGKLGTYDGTAESRAYRIASASIAKATVTIAAQDYTGKQVTPGKSLLTVKVGKTLLTDADYEITGYSNNTLKGTAKITLKGTGNYTGTKTATFKIVEHSLYMKVVFNGNGANSGSMKTIYVASNKPVNLAAFNFKKAGCYSNKTDGVWNEASDGSGTYYRNKGQIRNEDRSGQTIVLYAQWEQVGTPASINASRPTKAADATSKILVSWSPVANASSYIIYQSASENGSYTKVATATGTSCLVKSLSADKMYYFKVAAVVKDSVNGKNIDVAGNMSSLVGSGMTYAKPSLVGKTTFDRYTFLFTTTLTNKGKYDVEIDCNSSYSATWTETLYWWKLINSGTTSYDSGDLLISPKGCGISYWQFSCYSWSSFGSNNIVGNMSLRISYDGIYYKVTVNGSKVSVTALSYND